MDEPIKTPEEIAESVVPVGIPNCDCVHCRGTNHVFGAIVSVVREERRAADAYRRLYDAALAEIRTLDKCRAMPHCLALESELAQASAAHAALRQELMP